MAHYDSLFSPEGCLPNTRINVLGQMVEWVNGPHSTLAVYWLAGLAGTGKSTIAKTFCERMAGQNGVVLLTFFASKSSADRRDPFRMLYTFACQLAHANQGFCAQLLKALRSPGTKITTRPMSEQVERLLTAPLIASASQAPNASTRLILVIDALDECTTVNNVEGYALIPHLVLALTNYPIKLVITSRPETNLRKMFDSITNKTPFFLHMIADDDVEGDVHRILAKGFADICSERGISHRWPTEDEINLLVKRTGHLLIFASTVIRFVGDDRFAAPARLHSILERSITPSDESPFAEVDSLYSDILLSAAMNKSGQVVISLCNRLRLLVGAVILLQEPLDVLSLALLLHEDELTIGSDVRSLSSILLVEDKERTNVAHVVRLFHPSFRDFILERCVDHRFSVKSSQRHFDLALRCLRMLNNHLHEDICDIFDPTIANSEIPDLSGRLREYVNGVTRYASVHWVTHLAAAIKDSEKEIAELAEVLLAFSRGHLLHWIELLSLQGQISYALQLLPQIISWCQVSS
jgi:hypothetical protein